MDDSGAPTGLASLLNGLVSGGNAEDYYVTEVGAPSLAIVIEARSSEDEHESDWNEMMNLELSSAETPSDAIVDLLNDELDKPINVKIRASPRCNVVGS